MADIEIHMDNMAITVTEDSLKTSGIELAKSHIHLAKTTMNPSRPLTMVIWIENLSKEELEKIEGLPKTERIQLVRYFPKYRDRYNKKIFEKRRNSYFYKYRDTHVSA